MTFDIVLPLLYIDEWKAILGNGGPPVEKEQNTNQLGFKRWFKFPVALTRNVTDSMCKGVQTFYTSVISLYFYEREAGLREKMMQGFSECLYQFLWHTCLCLEGR